MLRLEWLCKRSFVLRRQTALEKSTRCSDNNLTVQTPIVRYFKASWEESRGQADEAWRKDG